MKEGRKEIKEGGKAARKAARKEVTEGSEGRK